MSDPTPVPVPTPEPAKPKQPHGLVNKNHEESLARVEKVLSTAQKETYAAQLAEREIDATFLTSLTGDCASARALLGKVLDKKTDNSGAVLIESAARDALVRLTREVQSAARQKYEENGPELRDYYIGASIDRNRPTLEQAVEAILKKLEGAKLPGITADKITALAAALKAFKESNAAHSGAQSDATGTRISLSELVNKVNAGRRQILFAVEAVWPYADEANAPIRREFGLAPNRPYLG